METKHEMIWKGPQKEFLWFLEWNVDQELNFKESERDPSLGWIWDSSGQFDPQMYISNPLTLHCIIFLVKVLIFKLKNNNFYATTPTPSILMTNQKLLKLYIFQRYVTRHDIQMTNPFKWEIKLKHGFSDTN